MKKIVRMFKTRKAKAMKKPCLIVTLGKGNWVDLHFNPLYKRGVLNFSWHSIWEIPKGIKSKNIEETLADFLYDIMIGNEDEISYLRTIDGVESYAIFPNGKIKEVPFKVLPYSKWEDYRSVI